MVLAQLTIWNNRHELAAYFDITVQTMIRTGSVIVLFRGNYTHFASCIPTDDEWIFWPVLATH